MEQSKGKFDWVKSSLKFVIIYDHTTSQYGVQKHIHVRGRWLKEGPPVFWSYVDGALEHIRKESK